VVERSDTTGFLSTAKPTPEGVAERCDPSGISLLFLLSVGVAPCRVLNHRLIPSQLILFFIIRHPEPVEGSASQRRGS
jgi:hypothetical protein